MTDFEKLGVFYLGREYDLENRKAGEDLVLYDSKDLVTHGVCVGMTGSGKTGLCISLLEEAAIDGIPALVIDPKGDLSNLLLTFPELAAEEFKPWVNADEASRKGVSVDDYASQQAEMWKNGLGKWGQDGNRVAALRAAADFTIYTPGSTAGVPVSILKSFAAPSAELAEDRELMRDRVSATATALLSLLGIDGDPLQSREHILVSTILDYAWRDGRTIDLATLIQQVQAPPVKRIGVLDLEAFYPEKERFKLAMQLNNLLASPGFEVWLEGDALDIQELLYTKAGKPRISIFSIAHLSDAERMFFVALLLNQTLSWMRAQPGTTSLRALLYMDEIFGYFPPVANPPSKKPLLTLLKQARAFGLGVMLATQNPVDLDYKGLGNTGTWFIGRLQTDRDKQRVLDGLEGAASTSGSKFDRDQMDQLLSGLGNRIFLMNNVHDDGPVIFETRWALSYLRGPLTRSQIKQLMDAKKAALPAGAASASKAAAAAAVKVGAVKPVLPPGIEEKFVPVRGKVTSYAPVILGAAQVRFVDTKQGVDEAREVVYAAPVGDGALAVNWEEAEETEIGLDELEAEAQAGIEFGELPAAAGQAKNYKTWSKDFAAWLYGSQTYDLFYSPSTALSSNAGENERDFRLRLQQAAREQRDTTIAALREQYQTRLKPIEERIFRAEQALEKEKAQSRSEKMAGVLSVGMSVLGMVFGGKRKSSVSGVVSGVRTAGRLYREGGDVDRAEESVERLNEQKAAMIAEMEEQVKSIQASADPMTEALEKIEVKPKKTNITVRYLGLVWKPE
ncbi:MAG: ATP-binding protein [Bryobacterales bacterium]|nr:ATP-binding protein [Bryobacterales bacterium]